MCINSFDTRKLSSSQGRWRKGEETLFDMHCIQRCEWLGSQTEDSLSDSGVGCLDQHCDPDVVEPLRCVVLLIWKPCIQEPVLKVPLQQRFSEHNLKRETRTRLRDKPEAP